MIRPILRPRLSITRVSDIAVRRDFVRQIYGLSATSLTEPVCCGAEGAQITRFAVESFNQRPGVRGPARRARPSS